MKKILIVLCFFAFSIPVIAQEKAKEVPFMPYVQSDMTTTTTSSRLKPFSTSTQTQKERKTTILFAPTSTTINTKDATFFETIAQRAKKNGSYVQLVTYRTPDMSADIAQKRIENVWNALLDTGLPQQLLLLPITERRVDPVISVHRVEIYEK